MLVTPFEHAVRAPVPARIRPGLLKYRMGCSRAASKPPFEYRTRLYIKRSSSKASKGEPRGMNWRRKISNGKRKTLSGKTHTDTGCLFLSLSLSNSNITTRCRAAPPDPNQDRLSVHSASHFLIRSEGCHLSRQLAQLSPSGLSSRAAAWYVHRRTHERLNVNI